MQPSPVKFLLVDDLEENQIALSALLRRDGLELLKAKSGPEALELLLVHDIALAILDVQMPGMDGFELAEMMRGTERTRRVPIIFLTAGALDNQRRFRGYEAGGVDFLFKPIEPHILRSKCEVFFELYRQRAEVARQRDELRVAAAENERLLELEQASRARAEQESRLKDEFLATLSHELRTPLNAILGWAQLLENEELPPEEAKQGLTVIERNARTQARLVDDLLDMSRIISGKIGLEIKPVRLPEIVDAAIHTVQPAAEAKGVVLRFLPHSPELPTVSGDSNRLQQVVWNLLSNAVKFTPRGGRVEIGLEAFANGVQLAVADTGEGIAPTFLPHVFDRFRQADGTTTRRHGGLGLGLSIVKNLVELHGGSIRALSSGKDRGSTFVVTLPITTPTRAADAAHTHHVVTAAEEEAEPCEIRLDGLKVLVIDDEPDAREVVRRFLETCGARVALANSVDDAMRTLPAQESDVIISDIGMPGQDGYELIRRVRALSNDQRLIPAIALTAFARAEDNRRAVDAGYNAHLAKPVTRTSLLRTVGQLVGKS